MLRFDRRKVTVNQNARFAEMAGSLESQHTDTQNTLASTVANMTMRKPRLLKLRTPYATALWTGFVSAERHDERPHAAEIRL